MMILNLICLIIFLAPAQASFSFKERNDYLVKVMNAFQETSRKDVEDLYQFINKAERNTCKSAYENLTLGCLKKEVQRNCQETKLKNCALLSDLVLVNKMNEKIFMTEKEKLRLTTHTSDYALVYGRNLLRKYAQLTTDFLLKNKTPCEEKDAACLTPPFNSYCMQNADNKALSWQACVSALIWFVSTSN